MDDDLLYGDIEDAGKDLEIAKLQQQLELEKKRSDALALEVNQLQEQVKVLVADRTQFETNMMSLFNTAKLELKRKDNELATLRGTLLGTSSTSSS